MINIFGGLIGGDQLDIEVFVGIGCYLILIMQVVECVYCFKEGYVWMDLYLFVVFGVLLYWLFQELILFEGVWFNCSLFVDLVKDVKFLMVEFMIFGCIVMGEVLNDVDFKDKICVMCDGMLFYFDGMYLIGDVVV